MVPKYSEGALIRKWCGMYVVIKPAVHTGWHNTGSWSVLKKKSHLFNATLTPASRSSVKYCGPCLTCASRFFENITMPSRCGKADCHWTADWMTLIAHWNVFRRFLIQVAYRWNGPTHYIKKTPSRIYLLWQSRLPCSCCLRPIYILSRVSQPVYTLVFTWDGVLVVRCYCIEFPAYHSKSKLTFISEFKTIDGFLSVSNHSMPFISGIMPIWFFWNSMAFCPAQYETEWIGPVSVSNSSIIRWAALIYPKKPFYVLSGSDSIVVLSLWYFAQSLDSLTSVGQLT